MFGSSFKITEMFGVDVYIDSSMLFLVVIMIMRSGGDPQRMVYNVLLLVPIFFIILLHEFGHVLTARAFGVETHDVILGPLGGVARLAGSAREHWQNLLISLGGPFVNVWIMVLFFIYYTFAGLTGSEFLMYDVPSYGGGFLYQVQFINLALLIFNMIPAFPLDGGQALRSTLAMFMDYRKATNVAVILGKFFAVLFIAYGIFSNGFILMIIGGFIFLAATREGEAVNNLRW